MTEQQIAEKIYSDAIFIASKSSEYLAAIEFNEMSEDEKIDYMNEVVFPAYEAAGSPTPLTEAYLLFTDTLFGRPSKTL